eukprot:TRINITY_DN5255_c0_g1_i1.p2 TRINITY_DN5255_c0_g1~~TRINITY_DN5255_c0_g1_i1.p2  ORF type:complete len:322 (-),score=46.69 TRINITY_DN5255_c0_g1_i1:569-1534(-)
MKEKKFLLFRPLVEWILIRHMEEGSFVCYVPRQFGLAWLPFGKSVEKGLDKKLALYESTYSDKVGQRIGSFRSEEEHIHLQQYASSTNGNTRCVRVPGCGILVNPGRVTMAEGLFTRVVPQVYSQKGVVVVFYGHLSNMDELLWSSSGSFESNASIESSLSSEVIEMEESYEDNQYAAAVLQLYLTTTAKDGLILMTALEGRFAFVLYDSNRREIIAARDPAGKETLFYNVASEGAIAFANAPADAMDLDLFDWNELQPGHCHTGRRIEQFAFSLKEIQHQDSIDEMEEDLGYGVNSPFERNFKKCNNSNGQDDHMFPVSL